MYSIVRPERQGCYRGNCALHRDNDSHGRTCAGILCQAAAGASHSSRHLFEPGHFPPLAVGLGCARCFPEHSGDGRVLSNGSPVGIAAVNYQITQGSGTLSSASTQTDSAGCATSDLQVNSIRTTTQVSVCVAPGNSPCLVFKVLAVSLSSLQLQPVGGTLQILQSGNNFQPVVMRVVDSSSPPHPVQGADVVFQSYTGRVSGDQPIVWAGEAGISQPSMPIIVAASQATVPSDVNGLASFPISTGGFSGNIAVAGSATVGAATLQFEAQQLGPQLIGA